MIFRKCDNCGSNLDPREICDCRKGQPMYSDNPVNDFLAHDAEQESQPIKLPRCAECGEHIQQESAVNIGGDLYCDSCLDVLRESIG